MLGTPRIAVLGAGLAGASTAYALARRGHAAGTHIFEQESACATHASAQNAAMVRSLLDEDGLAAWGIRGTLWWRDLPRALDAPGIFRRTSSVLLADRPSAQRLRQRAAQACASGLEATCLGRGEAIARWPLLEAVPFELAAHVVEDGVADPVALCDSMLRFAVERGATLRRSTKAEIRLADSGSARVAGLRLADGSDHDADAVVVAAGAWAPSMLEAGGARARGMQPWRRHIVVLGDDDTAARLSWPSSSPFVWHVDRGAYFRPESGRMLVSVCDSSVAVAGRPKVAHGEIEDRLHARLHEVFPFLVDIGVARIWAGLRTYRPSHDFVLGKLSEVEGLFGACGLGGHGVTCAGPVGEALAECVVSGRNDRLCATSRPR